MKKIFYALLFFTANVLLANTTFPENPYVGYFAKAYTMHPKLPRGVLEAVAFSQSRFQHIYPGDNSCIGYPQTHGVFGLVADGKSYFRNNLQLVASLSHHSVENIRTNPEIHILSYAYAFSVLQEKYQAYGNNLKEYIPLFIELSELPLANDVQNDFALNCHLYQLLWFLSNADAALVYGFPLYNVNFEEIFGDNYHVLSAKSIRFTNENHILSGKHQYAPSNLSSLLSPDYPPALWNPAASCNYSSRNGTQISAVAIHFVQGTYAGCISWFKNCSASASAHYVLRSSDGQVTQMVLEADKAWHVASENPYTVGLEHEGYINNISWFTDAMYNSSAALTKDICADNNINPLRTYYGPSCSGSSPQCQLGNCIKVKGHQHYANQTHTDPGPNWNWGRYYKLINNTYTATTYTALSGNFYDSGGPSGNYANDERKFWLFTNPNAANIALNFTSFNTELNYDYLFIYDGGKHNSPLYAQYNGTVTPPPVMINNDSMLVEFRSDCATVASGWAANYSITVNTTTVGDITPPVSQVYSNFPWKTSAFTATLVDQDNTGGSGVEKGYFQLIDFNGTEWRANHQKGFLIDHFDQAIHPEWTIKTGNWSIMNNALVQIDQASPASANTNIYAAVNQTLATRYMYHYYAKIEGSGNNRRAGFHFFSDNADSSNRNNSYFVWFRLDDQKIQIYKVTNNVFGSPVLDQALAFNAGQWYDVKVTFDRVSGRINVYLNNKYIAGWTDTSPHLNGRYVSFRSANCVYTIDELRVYRSRGNTASVTLGSSMAFDLRYQNPNPTQFAGRINSLCQDSAGNVSSVAFQDLNIDWTPPTNLVFVNDGSAADIQTINTTHSLSANWSTSNDPNSGIVRYWYSIGTAPGSTNTLAWTSNWGSTSVTVQNLTLTQGTVYYFNVMAENGAGLYSPVLSSNGQKVDSTYAIGVEEYQKLINEIRIYPNPAVNEIELVCEKYNASANIIINNSLGQLINEREITFKNGKAKLNLDLPEGTYFIILQIGKENLPTYKLIVLPH